MSVLLLVIGILLFIGLVVIHEFGHFIVARRNGVEVEEFGIFFPPRLWSRKTKSGWVFSINALPLGGFVKLKGEHDSDTKKGTFGAATLWVKTKIMAAGVVMNLLTALVLLTLLALIGTPKLINNQFTVAKDTQVTSNKVLITSVEPNSPAAKAGLQPLDELMDIQIPGRSPVGIQNSKNLPKVTKQFAGQEVNVIYSREGEIRTGKTKLNSTEVVEPSRKAFDKKVANTKLDCADIPLPKAYLGVTPQDYTVQKSTWSAPVTAVGFSAQITKLTFQGIGSAFGGLGRLIAGAATGNTTARQNGQCAASSQVSGPLGIYFILKSGSKLGFQYMLLIIAIISLTLAIMNILPIPALDGGRLWFTLASRAIGKPMTARTEEAINAAGFLFLMLLIILITFVDVKRFL
jgi:regulator of sigma E protease